MEMESTPDSGVEIKKAVVAPLLAPCLRSDTAAGNTPQDHNGMGMPRKAALNTEENRPRPRCLTTEFGLRNTRKKPLTSNPNKMYTDASSRRCQDSDNTFIINSKILNSNYISFTMIPDDRGQMTEFKDSNLIF